ncbi:hypothetical protein AB0E62_24815 [Streptomyces sp. NPDC038707]|uniref:hypothetical protein n=1 Tax=Streptomyces sp. NPDC038707 TaxID=3154329 RepID=UPI003402D28F
MPDMITPAGTGDLTSGDTGTGTARGPVVGCLGCGGLVLVLVLALVVVLARNAGGGTDLPRVAPGDRADRAFGYSQEAYDVMRFTRVLPPGTDGTGTGARNVFGAEYCRDGGLLGMEDRTVDGAYRLYHEWALDHVSAGTAVPGLRRLHRRLADEGWKVTSYTEGGRGKDWTLYVQRDHRAEWMTFTWDPERGYFTGGAGVPCAYDPAWTHSDSGTYDSGTYDSGTYDPDTAAQAVTPPVLGPGGR